MVRLEIEWTEERGKSHTFRVEQFYEDVAGARSSVPDWVSFLGIESAVVTVTISNMATGLVEYRKQLDRDRMWE